MIYSSIILMIYLHLSAFSTLLFITLLICTASQKNKIFAQLVYPFLTFNECFVIWIMHKLLLNLITQMHFLCKTVFINIIRQ